MKTIKKGCKTKHEINIENYLIKKKIWKENMEEIDIDICLKKINQKKIREYQKSYCKGKEIPLSKKKWIKDE